MWVPSSAALNYNRKSYNPKPWQEYVLSREPPEKKCWLRHLKWTKDHTLNSYTCTVF